MSPAEQAPAPGLTPESATATLAGFVWVDTDSNGVLDATEAGFGVADVSVYIFDAGGNKTVVTTDTNGMYSATVALGEYTVQVDGSTGETDFNEDLFAAYDPSTPLQKVVNIPAIGTPSNTNFGFNPRVEELTEKIQNGDIETNGLPVEYWRRQIILALTKLNPPSFGQPNPEEPDYEASELTAFLLEVEGLAFPIPFDLQDGNELVAALKILGDPDNSPLTDLLKEILAFELNHAAGLGLVNDPGLQLTLINYAESVYIQNGGLSPSSHRVTFAPAASGDLQKTKLLIEEVNRGGGGGPVQ